jgi:hypothetical protein
MNQPPNYPHSVQHNRLGYYMPQDLCTITSRGHSEHMTRNRCEAKYDHDILHLRGVNRSRCSAENQQISSTIFYELQHSRFEKSKLGLSPSDAAVDFLGAHG